MKTVVDYLEKHGAYEEDIANHTVKLKLAKKTIVMTVDDDRYLIKIFDDEVSPETEIRNILEDVYGANIRFCDVCGIPYDMGFMAGDGDWYCCQSCFDKELNDSYGKDGWRESEDEGEYGGYYEYLRPDGEWEDTGIFYTEWN